jgi:DNA-binding transcriptional LysR family regulator
MDVKEYKYILTVVKCGGISEAAQRLNISQPALSAYIKNLEYRTGITFFHKSEGVLHITSAGKVYLDYAQKIVDLDEKLSRELKAINDLDSGEVTIGITATRGMLYLPRILPSLKQKFPGITLKINECNSALQLEELIQHHKADFGFCAFPFVKYDFVYDELADEEIVVTIPADDPVCTHALKQNGKEHKWLDITLLKDRDFILHKKGQRLREAADEIFSKADIKPRISIETSSAITAYNLSKERMGLAITTSDFCMVQGTQDMTFFSIGNPSKVYTSVLAYVSPETLSNSAKAFIEQIKNIIKSYINNKKIIFDL